MEINITYYAGVYHNKVGGAERVLNVSDGVDDLSCEILADPGVASICLPSVKMMVDWAMIKARKWGCSHIEINCARGQGSYQWHKVK